MFSPYTPLAGGTLATYYNDKTYPMDLNGAQDYSREPLGPPAFFPYPLMIKAVQGLVPMFDQIAFDNAIGKNASGPWAGLPQGPVNVVFPDLHGGFQKEG